MERYKPDKYILTVRGPSSNGHGEDGGRSGSSSKGQGGGAAASSSGSSSSSSGGKSSKSSGGGKNCCGGSSSSCSCLAVCSDQSAMLPWKREQPGILMSLR